MRTVRTTTLLILFLVGIASTPAATSTVTTADDQLDSPAGLELSLREAIRDAAPGDTIDFAPGLSGSTIVLAHGQLVIDKDLVVDGSSLAQRITIDANGLFTGHRVLKIAPGGHVVTLNSLVIVGGAPNSFSYPEYLGGGIYNDGGTLTLVQCILSNHSANGGGGGIQSRYGTLNLDRSNVSDSRSAVGGGIAADGGNLNILESEITENFADIEGGGLSLYNCSATITRSTISENAANWGAGIAQRGETLSIERSTISDNSANTTGGGIVNFNGILSISESALIDNSAGSTGAGIQCTTSSGVGFWSDMSTTITNSTLSGNSASYGSGINHSGGTLTIRQSTIAENHHGGIYFWLLQEGVPVDLIIENSIIAGNTTPFGYDISDGLGSSHTITTLGTNLIGDNRTVADEFPAGPLVGTNAAPLSPRLAPVGNFGGLTRTMPPLPGSPAIDSASGAVPANDQRGFARPVRAPDIGAVENQGQGDLQTILPTVWALDFDGDGIPYGTEFAVGSNPFFADPDSPLHPVMIGSPNTGNGEVAIRFGINAAAIPSVRWVLMRSTNLSDYSEIYRFESGTETSAIGMVSEQINGVVRVIDSSPSMPRAFYKLEAQLLLP